MHMINEKIKGKKKQKGRRVKLTTESRSPLSFCKRTAFSCESSLLSPHSRVAIRCPCVVLHSLDYHSASYFLQW